MLSLSNILLIASFTSVISKNIDMVILHHGDILGRFDEVKTSDDSHCSPEMKKRGDCTGGLPRTRTVIQEHIRAYEESKGPKPLHLFSGNIFTGSVWFRTHTANISRDFMNLLAPDAIAIGKFEFEYGLPTLAEYVNGLNTPVLSVNVNHTQEKRLRKVKSSTIIDFEGLKVGVIGFLLTKKKFCVQEETLIFEDEVDTLKKESAALKQQGVQVIIALGSAPYGIQRLIALEVPFIDIVVSAGNDFLFWNELIADKPEMRKVMGPYPVVVMKGDKKVLIVTTPGNAKYLGRLRVTFSDKGDILRYEGQPIFLTYDIEQDEKAVRLLKKYSKEISEAENTIITTCKVLISGAKKVCRRVECNMGNMLADAYVDYVINQTTGKELWTNVPIGIVHAGSIHCDVHPSDFGSKITVASLLDMRPYNHKLVTFSLTGKSLKRVLEQGLANMAGDLFGSAFLQVSGLRLMIDRNKPKGSRIVSAKVRCGHCPIPRYSPISPSEIYNIVTTQYLTRGCLGHTVLKSELFDRNNIVLEELKAVRWYLEKAGIVYPQEEGRIQFVKHTKKSSAKSYKLRECSRMSCGCQGVMFTMFYVLFISVDIPLIAI